MHTDTPASAPVPRLPAPLDTVSGPRAAFALEHGLRHESAFRSFLPPPARRPASAGRPKARVYLAAIVVRRNRFPTIDCVTPRARRALPDAEQGSPEVSL